MGWLRCKLRFELRCLLFLCFCYVKSLSIFLTEQALQVLVVVNQKLVFDILLNFVNFTSLNFANLASDVTFLGSRIEKRVLSIFRLSWEQISTPVAPSRQLLILLDHPLLENVFFLMLLSQRLNFLSGVPRWVLCISLLKVNGWTSGHELGRGNWIYVRLLQGAPRLILLLLQVWRQSLVHGFKCFYSSAAVEESPAFLWFGDWGLLTIQDERQVLWLSITSLQVSPGISR